jgi:hypothetical protein
MPPRIGFLSDIGGATIGDLRDLGSDSGGLLADLIARSQEIGQKIFFIQQAFNLLKQSAAGAYGLIIQQSEQLNLSLLKSQTVIAQSVEAYTAQGDKLDDIRKKIQAFGDTLRIQRRQLEIDTKEIPGVTSAFTLTVFDNVLQRYKELQGQTKQYGDDLTGLTALAGNLTAALSNLGLVNNIQAVQETRALLTGDVNDPNSLLPQTLGVSRQEIEKARAAGELVDFLNKKLQPFREGSSLGALSISNELENITDAIQIFFREVGNELSKPLAQTFKTFRLSLEKGLADQKLIDQTTRLFQAIIEGTVNVGQAIGTLIQTLDSLGVNQLVADLAEGTGLIFKDLTSFLQEIATSINTLAKGLEDTLGRVVGLAGKIASVIPTDNPRTLNATENNKRVDKIIEDDKQKNKLTTEQKVNLIINREKQEVELTIGQTLVAFSRGLLGATTDLIKVGAGAGVGATTGAVAGSVAGPAGTLIGGQVGAGLGAGAALLDLGLGEVEDARRKAQGQERADELSKGIDDLKSDIVGFVKDGTKVRKELTELGADKSIEVLRDFSGIEASTGEASKERLTALTEYENALNQVNLRNREDVLETVSKLREAEKKANLSNAKERENLAKLLQFQVEAGIGDSDKVRERTQKLRDQAVADAQRINQEISQTTEIKDRRKLEQDFADRSEDIRVLDLLLQEAGFSAEFFQEKLTNLPNAGRIEALTSKINQGLRGIREASNSTELSESVKPLFKDITDAVNEGALEAQQAILILEQIASSRNLEVAERIQAEQILTQIVQKNSQQRIDFLRAEQATLQTDLSFGVLSQEDFNLENQVKQTEILQEELRGLESQVRSTLAANGGVESIAVQGLRNQVTQKSEEILQSQSSTLLIQYQNALAELERDSREINQTITTTQAIIERNATIIRSQGQLTGKEIGVLKQQENLPILGQQVDLARGRVDDLQATPEPPDLASQEERRTRIQQAIVELVQAENRFLTANIDLQRSQNEVILERVNKQGELISISDKEAVLAGKITTEQADANSRVLERVELQKELVLLQKIETSDKDEQLKIENRIREVRKQILDNQLREKGERDRVKKSLGEELKAAERINQSQSEDIESRKLSLAKQRLEKEREITEEILRRANDEEARLEAELDRLVAEGKAPKEAARRKKEEKEEKRRLKNSFIENRFTGSAEEQDVQQKLGVVRAEKAKATVEKARIDEEIAANERQQTTSQVGNQAANDIADLNDELLELSDREKALADQGLLDEEQKALIDERKALIVQRKNNVLERVRLEEEEKGLGRGSVRRNKSLRNQLDTFNKREKKLEEGVPNKTETELRNELLAPRGTLLKNLEESDLDDDVKASLTEKIKSGEQLTAEELDIVEGLESIAISQAQIKIENANIEGLKQTEAEKGAEGSEQVPTEQVPTEQVPTPLTQKDIEGLPSANLEVPAIPQKAESIQAAIDKVAKVATDSAQVKPEPQPQVQSVNQTTNDNSRKENLVINNQWGSLTEQRTLARTKGI